MYARSTKRIELEKKYNKNQLAAYCCEPGQSPKGLDMVLTVAAYGICGGFNLHVIVGSQGFDGFDEGCDFAKWPCKSC